MKKRIAGSIHSRGKLLLVAMCVSVGVGAFAVQALGSFGKARGFAVGKAPSSIAIGKFNGDGKRDLAVANSGSDNVSVLLGKGAGAFGKAKNFAVGKAPSSIAIGKFNGDAKPDIAVADAGSDSVSILLGKGDGTFGPSMGFAAGGGGVRSWNRSIAVGDFNNDTDRDLAVATTSGVSVLLGNGDGTFGPPTSFPAGINPASVVVGNFNADANLDLAVANSGAIDCDSRPARGAQASSCTGGFGTVSVLLGQGDGSFGTATDFPVGFMTSPVSMVLGNFNNDAKPDLALVDYFPNADGVSILLGKGAGAFGKAKGFPVGNAPSSLAVGDINQDSRDDLAVTSTDVSKSVSVVLGRGGGSFGAATNYSTGVGGFGVPTAVAIGNLNAGSNPDLAVAIRSSGGGGAYNRVAVLLNGGPAPRNLTLSYRAGKHKFTGRLRSSDPTCIKSQRVRVLRRRSGPDPQVGSAISAANGTYKIGQSANPGTYYARVRAWSACRGERSKTVTLHRH